MVNNVRLSLKQRAQAVGVVLGAVVGLFGPIYGVTSLEYVSFQRAKIASRTGNFSDAVQRLSAMVARSPNDRVLKAQLADALYDANRYADAQKLYTELLKTAEKSEVPDLWYNIGNAAYQQGDYQRAVIWYRKKLVEHPDDQAAKRNLELAVQQLKRRPNRNDSSNSQPQPPLPQDAMLNALDQLEQQARQNRTIPRPSRRPVEKDW